MWAGTHSWIKQDAVTYPRELRAIQRPLFTVALSCLALCDPMDCSLPGSSVHGILQVKNAGMGSHSPHQGIFLT